MLWHIFKYYLCFIIAVFFKRTKIKNAHYLRVKGPVIIAMNHPNAFMDPIAFTVNAYPPRVFYLARGDAFKKGIVTVLLESLGIIPIFRIQDGGKEGLKKNDETYERVNALLKRNQKIIIFAEGLCIQERRLRPLKKGVPRMVFGAMDAHNLKDLLVIPVGINYYNPSQFRSRVFFNIGKPIKVSDYMDAYKDAPAKTMNQFLADLTPKMKELIININDKHNEHLIEHIEEIYKHNYFKQHRLNLKDVEHEHNFSHHITEVVNELEVSNPDKLKHLYQKTKGYINDLKHNHLKDWLFNPEKQKQINYAVFSIRLLFIILTLPVYLIALVGNYIPYKLTDNITKTKVKLPEFKASFMMGIGTFTILFYYIISFFTVKALAPNYWYAIFTIIAFALSGWAAVHLSPFRKKTFGIYRVLKFKQQHGVKYQHMVEHRAEIIAEIKEMLQ